MAAVAEAEHAALRRKMLEWARPCVMVQATERAQASCLKNGLSAAELLR